MARAALVLASACVLAGCGSGPPTVDLTLVADPGISDAALQSIRRLDVQVSGAESFATSYVRSGLFAVDRRERVVYYPSATSGELRFAVTAFDENGGAVASGATSVQLQPHGALPAQLVLTAGPPGSDLGAADFAAVDAARAADLATTVDLGVPDLAQPDLHVEDLAANDLAVANDLAAANDLTQALDLFCADTWSTTCAGASPLGSLHVGSSMTVAGVLPIAGAENWFQASFPDASQSAYHPLVNISSPDGDIAFDLYFDSCSLTPLGCNEGGNVSAKTSWEVSNDCMPDPDLGACQALTPLVGTSGTILIRVFRRTAAATCNAYSLSLSD